MPPRSSGAQELGAQLQEQVESLRSSSSAAASRAERSLRAELAEARAEAALLRHELLQAEEAHAAAVEAGRVRRTASRVVENWRRHAALERSHGGVAAQLRRRMREADEQEAARLQQAALMRRELAQAEEAIAERDDARSQLREATAERDDARAQLRELLEHVRRADERADGDAAAIARLAELASSSQQALLESLNEIVELKRSTPRRRGRRRPDDDDGDGGGGGGGDSGVPRTSLEGIGGSGGGDEKVCVVLASTGTSAPGSCLASPTESTRTVGSGFGGTSVPPISCLVSPTESSTRPQWTAPPAVPPISLDHERRPGYSDAALRILASPTERRSASAGPGECSPVSAECAAPHASPPPPPGAVCDASCDPIDAQCVDALARRTAVPVSEAARVRMGGAAVAVSPSVGGRVCGNFFTRDVG